MADDRRAGPLRAGLHAESPLTPDLLIVGGGPAGLATAIRAADAGMRVRVIDHGSIPRDKACGEGLMPDGARLLGRLGVDEASLAPVPFRGIRYLDTETGAAAEGRFPGRPGWGIRRTRLHTVLAARAERSGVELYWRTAARGLEGSAVVTDAGRMTARWVIGADGLHSRVRRWAGLDGRRGRRRRFGVRRHYAVEPWSDLVEVYWHGRGEAYVTPVGPRSVGVAFLFEAFEARLADFPALAERLGGAPVESRDRGAGPLEQRARAVCRGNVALVGDAAGYLDAITGEGLALAFHQAFALVDALRSDDPRRYARACRRITRQPLAMTRLLLAIERRPRLRRRVILALRNRPRAFERLLAVHARAVPAVRLLGADVLGLLGSLAMRPR